MKEKKLNWALMKQSYAASQIALAASIAQAFSFHINRYNNNVGRSAIKNSTSSKFNIKKDPNFNRVGIKFDYSSAEKYFVLIHATQSTPCSE